MTIYTLNTAQAPNARTATVSGEMTTLHGRLTLGPTLLVGDVIKIVRVPALARVRNWMLFAQKLDGGGAPTFAFNYGDTTNPTRFAAAANVGQAGGALECAVSAAPKGYQYLADDTLILTVTAAAQAQVSGAYLDVYLDTYQG